MLYNYYSVIIEILGSVWVSVRVKSPVFGAWVLITQRISFEFDFGICIIVNC